MSKPLHRPPRLLRFATWPYRPRWLVEPVLGQVVGRELSDLTTEEASSLVEGLALLQGVRAPLFAFPPLTLAAALDSLGVSGVAASLMWVLTLSAVLVLPFYMVVVGVLHLRLRRAPESTESVGSAHPRLVTALRAAPLLAFFLAGAAGVSLH